MKVAFIIGHHKEAKGAYSKTLAKQEWDFYKDMESDLEEIGHVFEHESTYYNKRQRLMAKQTWDYDLVFELHFNAYNENVNGCEAFYYYRNDKTKKTAQFFCDQYTENTKTNNRGAKPLSNHNQRGYGFLVHQKPAAILLEPFFGDNPEDAKLFDKNMFIDVLKKTINFYSKL